MYNTGFWFKLGIKDKQVVELQVWQFVKGHAIHFPSYDGYNPALHNIHIDALYEEHVIHLISLHGKHYPLRVKFIA